MAKLQYQNIVPKGTFIGQYMDSMKSVETAYAYDFWCAVWLMSLALGRDVIIPRPGAEVYMNWYLLFVSESGITRKSSAVRKAQKMAIEFIERSPTKIEMIQNKSSPEGIELILQRMSNEHGYAHAAICVDELVRFLGRERYAMELPGLLTDLYDSPSLRTGGGTVARGQVTIKNVYLSFLSASTPSWLGRAINPDVIEGGFTSRTLFICSETRKRKIPWPDKGDGIDASRCRRNLITELVEFQRIGRTNREIGIDPEALRRFSNWYSAQRYSKDPFLSSFQSREDSHILRLAAYLSINRGDWNISEDALQVATKCIESIKRDGHSLFAEGSASSEAVKAVDKIRTILLEAGLDGIKQSAITTKVRGILDAETIRTVLAIMHELEYVQKFQPKHKGAGRPTTLWRGTTALMDARMLSTVVRRMPAK